MSAIAVVRRDLDLVLRYDLAAFIQKTFQTLSPGQRYDDNWHIQAMARGLQQTVDGNVKRLLITLPPRNLKSISAVAFSAWALGHDPSKRIVCASYSADLASKHAQDCRAVMESEPIQRFHRDAHAASHHAALAWDVWAEQFGRQALGLGPA